MAKRTYPRPIVVVSKCLGIDHCRYDGQMSECDLVRRLADHATIIPVCPEVEIGLGIPRDKIRLVKHGSHPRLIQPATGRYLTTALRDFSRRFLADLDAVDGFILKSRSPSCGIRDTKIFDNRVDGSWGRKGTGLFAEEILKRLDGLPVEDENRLARKRHRHRFLIHLFAQAAIRAGRPAHTDGSQPSAPYPPELMLP